MVHLRLHNRHAAGRYGLGLAGIKLIRLAQTIFSNALNFRCSAIAAFVRSPGGPPLPLAPPCNRQRPFFVAGDRQGFPLLVRAPQLAQFFQLNPSPRMTTMLDVMVYPFRLGRRLVRDRVVNVGVRALRVSVCTHKIAIGDSDLINVRLSPLCGLSRTSREDREVP